MGIRETLSEKPRLVAGAGASFVALVALYGAMQFWSKPAGVKVTQKYFSSDDGKTFFADDAAKFAPFQGPGGGEAVEAIVFSCDGGKTRFVGYLQKLTPEARKAVGEFSASDPKASSIATVLENGTQIKRPGEKVWRSSRDLQEFVRVQSVSGPDGKSGTPEPVLP